DKTRTEIEAEVFRRLLQHLDERKDVQNIDLMNLAGFCRNCLAKWYVTAATNQGTELDLNQAREIVYGMPYPEWKRLYRKEASPEQVAAFNASGKKTGSSDA
ncbi:MAG: DUF1244 domain-containing protein, partial [Thioalkalivibrio sp.]|nr:DUF1244 domain-containing protein [Thioalkalivibrio sp.]